MRGWHSARSRQPRSPRLRRRPVLITAHFADHGVSQRYFRLHVNFLEGSLGISKFSQSSRDAGFYAQNQWKVTPDLVVTAGVRYDLQFLKGVKADTNNVAPQLGFAWSPGGSRSTVIRGGFGLMYQQLPLPAISGALEPGGNTVNLIRSGTFTTGSNRSSTNVLGTFTTVDPSIQNAYAEQVNWARTVSTF